MTEENNISQNSIDLLKEMINLSYAVQYQREYLNRFLEKNATVFQALSDEENEMARKIAVENIRQRYSGLTINYEPEKPEDTKKDT